MGYYADVPWLSPLVVFLVVPALDALLPEDGSGAYGGSRHERARWWLNVIPQLYVIIWLAVLVWALVLFRTQDVPTSTSAWLLFSLAISTAFATCAAHELLHWPERLARGLARVVMATVAYGHFPIEHVHHHTMVGIRDEGTTPPPGQSVWSFLVRNAVFSFRSAWAIERRPQSAARHSLINNRFVQQWLLTVALVLLFWAVAGAMGLVLFVFQAAFGIYTTEYVNYAQHYGLSRSEHAPIAGDVSWSSNALVTNALTLNITRHAHHHIQSELRYYELEHMQGVPMLPAGYLALFFPAMIPPLWRALMDPRVRVYAGRVATTAPLKEA
jgi:alkane 1-monooxygenase